VGKVVEFFKDYVGILNIDFMIEIEHVTRTKVVIKSMLKY
jgi:hypothetical protein